MNKTHYWLNTLACALLAVPAAVTQAVRDTSPAPSDSTEDDWFDGDDTSTVPQVGPGELLFLATPSDSKTPLSQSRISVSESSLATGWVELDQCYQGLDAVPAVEVVYRYHAMRGLRIVSTHNIGRAIRGERSVQLSDVQQDATLCIQAEVRILYEQPDGGRVLRNGPFHRKFLDGYFPLHVSLEVRYPAGALRYLRTSPQQQPGFVVATGDGVLTIDSWFAGALYIEISFEPVRQDRIRGRQTE
jgi:hypothetical protein